jgi:hypothetical protein
MRLTPDTANRILSSTPMLPPSFTSVMGPGRLATSRDPFFFHDSFESASPDLRVCVFHRLRPFFPIFREDHISRRHNQFRAAVLIRAIEPTAIIEWCPQLLIAQHIMFANLGRLLAPRTRVAVVTHNDEFTHCELLLFCRSRSFNVVHSQSWNALPAPSRGPELGQERVCVGSR